MEVIPRPAPFGSATRTRALVLLQLLGSSYARELARLLGVSVSVAQKALASLERDDLVAAQAVGRTRVYRLNPRYFARGELEAYLRRLVAAFPDLDAAATRLRRRPRKAGKPL
ncbi:MAG: winged helix-turn-helix domain-containing protein [Vicinamibacterales bacterium]